MPGAMGLCHVSCDVMTASSHVQQKELALPWADHLHEGLEFSTLDAGVDADELLAEHLFEGRLVFHERDGFKKAAWQFDRPFVCRVFRRRSRLDLFHDAKQAACERS